MKKLILLSALICLMANLAQAQYNTGDVQLNASLSKIDANAEIDFGSFKADIGARYDVSTNKIDSWSVNLGMKAGDIYMALELAKITQKNPDEVVSVYQKNKNKGWGVIAKELGIKPGSPEFHALKNNAGNGNGEHGNGKGKGNQKQHGNPHSREN